MPHKEDIPIEMLAEQAIEKGYQVLSFDLPEHGERKDEDTPCKVQPCVKDLTACINYGKKHWQHISLFAQSMGAYFSLLAYSDACLEKAFFLSPVVNMERIIQNMMLEFHVTEEQLKKEQIISTPVGQKLYWDYHCYVKENPITTWNVPTSILYGKKDFLCEKEYVLKFKEKFSCDLQLQRNLGIFSIPLRI